MNIVMQIAIVVALCLCLADGAPDGRVARKQQRPTRGFKNVEMMTARGFGKRAEHHIHAHRQYIPNGLLRTALDFGKRSGNDNVNDEVMGLDNFWENLDNAQEKDGEEMNSGRTVESIPLDWFVNEMINNPDFARSIIRKFVDLNQDGVLSADELLRNV